MNIKKQALQYSILVDVFIADEIKKLNNGNDIFTPSSCCGHGELGYIVTDIQSYCMKYLDKDIIVGDINVLCASKYHCTENCQMCYPHPVHAPGKYCDCGS